MTANQINYFKAREDVRSHIAQEAIGKAGTENAAEANRINLIRSGIDAQNAATNSLLAQVRQYESVEQARANQAREYETQRHNIAMENEQLRSNTAQEALRMSDLREQQRSNLASEQLKGSQNYNDFLKIQETQRSNLVRESQDEARLWDNEYQMHLQSSKQDEEARHNRAMEGLETRKSNQGALNAVTNFVGKVFPVALSFLGA